MLRNAPDMIDLRMRLFVAIVGVVLMVVAWLEYWL
jgi:predicted membrane-bound mannosyltransferase